MARGGYLGEFEPMVMLAVLGLDGDAYGVTISREIEKNTRREVSIGSVYAALERLEEKKLLVSSPGDPTAELGGRAKRYFQITGSGLTEIRQSRKPPRLAVLLLRSAPESSRQ